MTTEETSETTRLLQAWVGGDAAALEQLTARMHSELLHIAHLLMRNERPGQTLQTAALVNEAYLRLVGAANLDWQHRVHFLAGSSRIMRNILVDAARKRRAKKRGGEAVQVNLDEVPALSAAVGEELLALDQALGVLATADPRKGRVVELRFFGGLSVEEAAAVLDVSPDTVTKDWKAARAWLLSELKAKGREPNGMS